MKTGAPRAVPRPHLPDELEQFIKQDSFLLFVKGAAGTGKTSLALAILNALGINDNCLYISTRASPDQIVKHYPWLKGLFTDEQLYGKDKAEFSTADLPVFVDAKLEESAGVFEMITNKLMDARAPTIVIDTWDAIGYSDREALTSNIRVLDTWCRRASAKLIIISEQADDTTVDSLADGVVVLRQQRHDDRIMREIELSKLSGVQTRRPSYLFTLKNGIFKSYGPHRPSDFVITQNWMDSGRKAKRPGIRRGAPFIPTGHRELDSLLGGGFPQRGIVNIELGPDVNPKVAVVFLGEAIRSFADTNNSVLFLPFEGLDQGYVDHHLRISSAGSSQRELMRTNVNRDIKTPRLVTVEQAGMSLERKLASFQEILSKMRKDHPGKLVLDVIGSNIVRGPKETQKEHVEFLATVLRTSADLSVIVSRHSDDAAYTAGISDIHLKIIDVKGTLFLQPQKPWAGLYAIAISRRLGRASMRLEPVV
jgi:KaiC/GvpD/RAD55 family RecA-like ATPase